MFAPSSTAGGPGRNRTSISQLRRLVLYPLSYGALMRSGHLAIVSEVVGIRLGLLRGGRGLEYLIRNTMLVGISDGLLFRLECELHLAAHVVRARPAHQ